jgi:hypothetical protein
MGGEMTARDNAEQELVWDDPKVESFALTGFAWFSGNVHFLMDR